LRDIGASNNKISGNLPVSYLPPNLEELFIANNQLTGEVSLTLADLPLSWVILDYNALTAIDPTLITFLDGVNSGWDDTQTVPVNNLATANPADTSIDLTWTAINYTADGGYYEVSYATDPGGTWTVHGQTTDKTATGYSVTSLNPGTTYYFRVQTHTPAHDTQQNDLWSEYSANVSEATTGIALPIAPTVLTAMVVSETQIDLSWTDNSSDETAFHIERSPDGSTGWDEVGTVGADVTTYSDTTVACSETHYYRVHAYRSGDTKYSAYSNVTNATTSSCPPVEVSTTITESVLFNQMQTEIVNAGGQIDFALIDFVPGAINFTIRTKDGTVGTVVVYVEDGADFGVFSVGAISVDGNYATTINSELMHLLIDSLDALFIQRAGTNHDLIDINVTDMAIEVMLSQ
jgi:hypothetical protein